MGTAKTRMRRARQRLAEHLGRVAESKALLDGTLAELDRWARELRASMAAR